MATSLKLKRFVGPHQRVQVTALLALIPRVGTEDALSLHVVTFGQFRSTLTQSRPSQAMMALANKRVGQQKKPLIDMTPTTTAKPEAREWNCYIVSNMLMNMLDAPVIAGATRRRGSARTVKFFVDPKRRDGARSAAKPCKALCSLQIALRLGGSSRRL